MGSVSGGALPALSCQVWKCIDLAAADAEQDAQHLLVGDPLRERRVEAGAALLDPGEMEPRRVGDRLQVLRWASRSASVRGIAGC